MKIGLESENKDREEGRIKVCIKIVIWKDGT